jgi:hypothetical protein
MGPRPNTYLLSGINSFIFPKEATVQSEADRLQEKLNQQVSSLNGYAQLKGILWLRDDELVSSVISFFNEMKIATRRDEIYEEDFLDYGEGQRYCDGRGQRAGQESNKTAHKSIGRAQRSSREA